MLNVTVLFVSSECSLTRVAQEVSESISHLRLNVCEQIADARSQLDGDDVTLAVIHLPEDGDEAGVLDLVRMASERAIAAVVLSDRYDNQQAFRLLRAGAADYLGLPLPAARLAYLLNAMTVRRRSRRCNGSSPPKPCARGAGQEVLLYVWGPETAELVDMVQRVAPQDTTLLISGETGTGKTRLARLIHELSSGRDDQFQVVDCGALSPSLIESEMFGHVKGAFTGAERDRQGKFAAVGRGTLLLDEVNSMPVELQGKLLRAVDDRVFEPVGANKPQPLEARLIAVSNSHLPQEVQAGRFRSDLYYRLNVVGFYLPPLRERQAAVPHLVNRFLAEFTARNRPDLSGMDPELFPLLQDYAWPGNIREMRNVIERAVALSAGPVIRIRDLPEAIRLPQRCTGPTPALYPVGGSAVPPPAATLAASKENAEVQRITEALHRHGNNRLRAAAELGISRMSLYKKLHKYGMMQTA